MAGGNGPAPGLAKMRDPKVESRAKMRVDLAHHLVHEHGWRASAAVGLDYMVARHLSYRCGWGGLNRKLRGKMSLVADLAVDGPQHG